MNFVDMKGKQSIAQTLSFSLMIHTQETSEKGILLIYPPMKLSTLFTKTTKEDPKGEVSSNALLLTRAGCIYKEMAGVYTFLPLGLKVINKIKDIVRKHMDTVASELSMTVL